MCQDVKTKIDTSQVYCIVIAKYYKNIVERQLRNDCVSNQMTLCDKKIDFVLRQKSFSKGAQLLDVHCKTVLHERKHGPVTTSRPLKCFFYIQNITSCKFIKVFVRDMGLFHYGDLSICLRVHLQDWWKSNCHREVAGGQIIVIKTD